MKILKKYQPIGVWRENLLLYKRGNIFIWNKNTQKIVKFDKLYNSFAERFLSYSSCLTRLLRLGVRTSYIDNMGVLFLFFGTTLIEYNLINKNVENITQFNSRSLYFSEIDGIRGFDNSIIFGEYFSNSEKKEVQIFSKNNEGIWKSIYVFPKGIINHIHNIIPDKYNSCLWIFTGDFGKSAAIWKIEDNFKKVECVLKGEQIYRSCVGFSSPKGLIYATDTPFSKNSIRRLYKRSDDGAYVSEHIQDINGSCIYGCRYNNEMYFSTAVEPNGIFKNKLHAFLSRNKGDGIKDYKSYLYKEIGSKFEVVYSSEKDFYPFVLFRFGSIQFPAKEFKFDYLPIYHVASKKYDLSTLLLKI